jgi:hypothetical protein
MADKDTEQIKYETELLKLMALFILAVGGGAIGLMLGEQTSLRLLFILSGVSLSILLVIGVWRQHKSVRRIISQIKEPLS